MVTTTLCPRHSLIHMPHNSHTDYTRITSYTNTPHQFPRICPYIYIPLSMASSLSISVGPTQWKRKTRNTNTTLPWAAGSIVLDGHVDKTKFNASLDIIPSELGCLECPNVPPKPKCPHLWANRTITYTHSERSDGGHHMRCACFLSLSLFLGGGGASEFTFCYADNGEYGTERAIIRLSFWLIAIIDSQYI